MGRAITRICCWHHLTLTALLICGGTANADPATVLPFEEQFARSPDTNGWVLSASQGNSLAAKDGALHIDALANTYAHLARPLSHDNIRATFAVSPDSSASWTPSLFLYWDPANWVQVGYRGAPFTAVMADGQITEADASLDRSHRWRYDPVTCSHQPALPAGGEVLHRLGIDLGPGTIRFLTSDDGASWSVGRTVQRPGGVTAAPPKLLIVGKGYSSPVGSMTAAELKNEYHDRGTMMHSRIRDVRVSRLSPAEADAPPPPPPGRDEPGERLLSQDGEPTFDSVSAVFPPLKYSRELVGVQDHPGYFAVTPDGALHFDSGYAFFEIGGQRLGLGDKMPAKRLHHGSLPIVIATHPERSGVTLEQTVFGHSAGFGPDAPLFAYCRLSASNTTDRAAHVEIACRIADRDGKVADQPAARWTLDVPARETRSVFVKLPFPATPQNVTQPTAQEFDQRLAETERHWTDLLDARMRIHTPEQRVNDAYRAWLAFNFLNVRKRPDGVFEPQDCAGVYPAVYGISAALYCRILDDYGYHADARRYIESLMTFVKPDGSCLINYGLPDSGALLMAVGDHLAHTRDVEWARKVAPTVQRMCDWIIAKRQEARASQDKSAPWYGMLYEKPYCDYLDKAYNFVSDIHLAAGLVSAAEVLAQTGSADLARRYAQEAEAYRTDLVTAMGRSAVERRGMRMIPMFPQTHANLKASDYTAADYYGLLCGQMLEKGLLPPDSWEARSFTTMLEQHGGLLLGMCKFEGGIDHAYTYGYWHNCLQRDEHERVLLGFYGSMAYGMSRGTYSGVEVTYARTGMNHNTLPHLYSGTQQLRLLRNMLIREEGDGLILCQGAPTAWLKDLRVEQASTRFGTISFHVRTTPEGTAEATIDPAPDAMPVPVTLYLRGGKAIRSATAHGKPVGEISGPSLRLPRVTKKTSVSIRYQ